jgi:uncharacterized cupredoxin-like copper-binding protein
VEESADSHNIGEIAKLLPGETKALTLNMTKEKYVLICNPPGHYKAGMYAGFEAQ